MLFVELVEKSGHEVDDIARAVQEQAAKPAAAPSQAAPAAPSAPGTAAPTAAPAPPAPKPPEEDKVRFRKSYGES